MLFRSGRCLQTFFSDMSGLPTEETEVLLKAALLLLLCELAVFTELGGEVGVGLFLVSIATARVSITRVTRVARVALSAIIVCVALPFIIIAFILVSGWIFSGHLRMVLPIMRINRLGEGTEFMEGVRFADVSDFVLDSGWKSTI